MAGAVLVGSTTRVISGRMPEGDGRRMKTFLRRMTQLETFELGKGGLWQPKTEGIMQVRDFDRVFESHCGMGKCFNRITDLSYIWRSGEFAFYRAGVDRDLTLQIGKKLWLVEAETDNVARRTGNIIAVVFNVPEEAQKAVGLGVLQVSALSIALIDQVKLSAESLRAILKKELDLPWNRSPDGNEGYLFLYEVRVTDFDPESLKIKDIVMSPREDEALYSKYHGCSTEYGAYSTKLGWSVLVDEDGYPLNNDATSYAKAKGIKHARFCYMHNLDDFNKHRQLIALPEISSRGINVEELGYFASVGRDDMDNNAMRRIRINDPWFLQCSVAIVEHKLVN